MFGFLNVYKPKGVTSHDVVSVLRRITKIKQIGHTGTLDPFAEGVLPICIGKATRLIEYLEDDKAYIGIVQLGQSTSTYDIEGEITNASDINVTYDEIQSAISLFKGEIKQIPPIFSAIKVNGKKLYEYARNGEDVKIEPRTVNISELELLNFDSKKKQIEIKIACSKGTYIRSIANDLGNALGTYGYLVKLTRIKAGRFLIENSIRLDDLNSIEMVEAKLINPLDYLSLQQYSLTEIEKEKVSHGMNITVNNLLNGAVVLTYKNQLIAVGNVSNSSIKCLKVFI